MRHQLKKGFWGIFVKNPQHPKGYLIYITSKRKIVSSNDVIFDEIFSSALAYTSRTYSESLATRLAVLYIPYATSYPKQNGDFLTLAQFKVGHVLKNEHYLVED